jgi:hypothetical protein
MLSLDRKKTERFAKEPLNRNVKTDFDCALYVIIARAGSRTLAESITRFDGQIAILTIRRIASSLPNLEIHDLYASRLT